MEQTRVIRLEIELGTIKSSPYLGVFSLVTEKFCLLPKTAEKKEVKRMEKLFEVEAIQTNLANSSLIGVLAAGNSKGIVVPEIAEAREIAELESAGIRVKQLKGVSALGNLVEVNDSKGLCSEIIPKETVNAIEGFLKVQIMQTKIASSDLVGSSIVATGNGFIVNPKVEEKEFNAIQKHLQVKGNAATANYGDLFVGNGVIANSNAAMAGSRTSGHELAMIDDGLGGI